MALTTTVAGANSDAYATLAMVNAYATEVGDTTWSGLSDAVKENYIKRATRLIDRYPWAGCKYDVSTVTAGQEPGQRLQFPRDYDLDGNGDPFIGDEVEVCCGAVAIALANGASEYGGAGSDASVKRLRAGQVEVEFDTETGAVTAVTADDIVRDVLGHRLAHSVRTW